MEKTTESYWDHLEEYLEDAICPNDQSPQMDSAVCDWPQHAKKDDLFKGGVSIF